MAMRGNVDFPNLTDELIRWVEKWSAESNDGLLDAMTVEPPTLLNDKGWRQDAAPVRPTVEAIRARFDALAAAGDVTLKNVCKVYCGNRSKFSGDSVQMACGMLDAFISSHFQAPWPLASLAVFTLRNGVIDRVCKCPDDPC